MRTRTLWISTLAGAALMAGAVWADKPLPGNKGNKPGRHKGKVGTVAPPGKARPRGIASPNAVREDSKSNLVYGETITFHNLSLVPVGTRDKGPFQKYTLLEQGLAARTLRVRELNGKSGQARVPAVEVRNKGAQPVYLLGGEMILGGKQDRIIQQDTVVPNDGKWTRVSVFCVESGRWRGQNMKFKAGKAMAHVALRRAAMSGNQSAVWAEVARKNVEQGTQNSTSTYRRTIQNAKVRARIARYRRQLAARLPADLKVAGMVFAINGEIRVADLLGNPVLFSDLKDKLLSAYILEALGQQVVRNARPVSKGAARRFLRDARKARKYKLKGAGQSDNYRRESSNVIGAETVDKKTGKMVRETYIRKKRIRVRKKRIRVKKKLQRGRSIQRQRQTR